MRRFLIIVFALASSLSAIAQQYKFDLDSIFSNRFSHLQIDLAAGTTGLGVDFSTPLTDHISLRGGFMVMPNIAINKSYSIASEATIGDDISKEENERRITHLCEYLSDLVNAPVDKYVEMEHQLSFCNARLLVDWYPFSNKPWHFTAGAYVGFRGIGKAFCANAESNTVVAINLYNNMYDQIQSLDEYEYPYFTIGSNTFELNPEQGQTLKDAFNYYGRIAIQLGEFPDGTPHYVTPDQNGVMQVKAEWPIVKPFLGFGWSKNLGYDQRWTLNLEAGALFMGKTHVYCNDGVDLVNDVSNISGTVGSYIRIIKAMPFYPLLECRLAYRIF